MVSHALILALGDRSRQISKIEARLDWSTARATQRNPSGQNKTKQQKKIKLK